MNRSRMTIAFSFLAGALALAIAGCGGGGGTAVTESSFCTDKAEAECGKLQPRCMFPDESACVTYRTKVCVDRGTSQKSSTRVFKPKNTGACLSTVKSVLGKDAISAADWQDMVDTCDRVWEGGGEQQAPCTSPYDCLNPFVCDKGYCAKTDKVGATDFCTDPGKVCPDAQYCKKDPASTFWGCQARASLTQDCGPTAGGVECGKDLYCRSGKCTSRLANLEACQVGAECTSDLCDPFLGKCVTTIGFATGSPSCDGFVGKGTPVPTQDAATVTPTPDAMSSTDAAAGN